jgi:predicted HTH domain antitoxin
MCANPTCRHILTLELHHIVRVRDHGGNEPSNLIALCANCHALHTRGHIPITAVRVWKEMLISLNSVNRSNVDVLLHLFRMERDSVGKHVRYSGDSLLQLAGLLNAGLVRTGSARTSSGCGGFPPFSSFEVKLTDRGSALVEAWLKGDEQRYISALRASGAGVSRNEVRARGLPRPPL